jgi:ribosomal protein S18 acetylase RimI-like enzyme
VDSYITSRKRTTSLPTYLNDLVRISKAQEIRASETLTYAFRDYPLYTYVIPSKFDRDQKLRILLGFMIRFGISYGEAYATSPNMEGVAIWFPSDKAEISIWKAIRVGGLSLIHDFLTSGRDFVPKLLAYNEYASKIHNRHAPFPHLYLNLLGVDPNYQGRGYASALIKPMLTRIDGEHLPCFLETHNERSVPIYKHFGFKIVEEGTIPGTDIVHHAMLRGKRTGETG